MGKVELKIMNHSFGISTGPNVQTMNGNTGSPGRFSIVTGKIPYLLGGFVFLSPFPHNTSMMELCFYGALLLTVAGIAAKSIDFSFRSVTAWGFAAFFIWSSIGTFFALNVENTFHDIFSHLFKYVALYYLLLNFFQTRKRFLALTWAVTLSGGIFSTAYLIYFYDVLGNPLSERMVLFPYRDYIYVAAFIIALGHLFSKAPWPARAISGFCMVACIAATLLSQTRNALLAILVAVVIYGARFKKWAVIVFITIVLSAWLSPGLSLRLTHKSTTPSVRVTINWVSFLILKDHPLFGIGYGMQTYGDENLVDLATYHRQVPEKYRHQKIVEAPHNLLMDIAVRTGVVGLAIYLFILIKLGWAAVRLSVNKEDEFIRDWARCALACLAAYLTQAMFGDAAFGLQAIVGYTIFAMIAILHRMKHSREKQQLY